MKSTSTCQGLLKLLLSCALTFLVMSYIFFFGNWFSSYVLLVYLKTKGIYSSGKNCANRLQGCSIESSKTLSEAGHWAIDYRHDENSGLVIKTGDNSVATSIRFCWYWAGRISSVFVKEGQDRRRYLALCHIPCKMNEWYQKIFWKLTDIAKVNLWLLYSFHFLQYYLPKMDMKFFLMFFLEIRMDWIKWHLLVFETDHQRGDILFLYHWNKKIQLLQIP